MTEAEKILNPRLERTPRERMQMCDYWAPARAADIANDLLLYTFRDGSQILLSYDENLRPIEFVIIE